MPDNKIVRDFTKGSIPKQLFWFMLPFIGSNTLQIIYSLVDMIIVGRYVGSAGLTAVSQGGLVTGFATMICMGFSKGGLTIVSHLIGGDNRKQLKSAIGTLFSIMLILGIAVSAAAIALRSSFAALLNVPDEARQMCKDYLFICGFGLFFLSGYNSATSLINGMGDSRHPFILITISSVINLVLDFILTGVCGLGVRGAAVATLLSQIFLFVSIYLFLYQRRAHFGFDFKLQSFRISKQYLGTVVRLGIPLAIQACAISISMMVCNRFINSLGISEAATFGVGLKVDDLFNKVVLGVQYAAAPMVGQNFGAEDYGRVQKVICWTWIMSAGICVVFLICYLCFGSSLFGLFSKDHDVAELAPVFISAAVWSFPAMTLMRGTNALLQGIGNSRLNMIFSFGDSGLRFVLSYLLGIVFQLGFFGFTLGYMLAPYAIAIPGTLYFISRKWKHFIRIK